MNPEYYEPIRSVSKIFPEHVKHVEFKTPIWRFKDGVSHRSIHDESYALGLVNQTYDEYLEHKKQLKQQQKNNQKQEQQTYWQLQLPFDEQFKRFQDTLLLKDEVTPILQRVADSETLQRSLNRSIQSVRELGYCNDFDMFITFTFGRDHLDVERSIERMTVWLNDQRKQAKKNDSKFDYLLVMEYHKQGGVHFHGLFSGYRGRFVESRNPKTGKPVVKRGKLVYNLLSWTHGFSTMTHIVDKNKTVSYLTKYMTKEMLAVTAGKKRYWRSRDLQRPRVVRNTIPEGYDTGGVIRETEHFKLLFIKKPDTLEVRKGED